MPTFTYKKRASNGQKLLAKREKLPDDLVWLGF
jgi:hypothetical protein